MSIIIKLGILFLNIIYLFLKPLPTKNKITFISRQANSPSIDIKMLCDQLNKIDDIRVVVLCKCLESGIKSKILYIFHMFKQMYHLSTSKVIVLDSYCIVASILKHKKNLKIIQMWHGLGSMKKFGYSILDSGEGRSSKIAKLMKMHENYNYVFVSSKNCIDYLSEAYKCEKDIIRVMPLPRVDLLCNSELSESKRNDIIKHYPILKDKKNILYAPTFRKNGNDTDAITELINNINFDKYNFILKTHPLTEVNIENIYSKNIINDRTFETLEMITVADYVITDYSAIIYEVALNKKPIYFYTYDLDDYKDNRNFYINFEKEVPGLISYNASDIIKDIDNNIYDMERINIFADKYVDNKINCTKKIIDFILKIMN
ncbi:CDP-glycerol glycerophosphotransferase family protein [Anaerofustis stercorihominis]|uniref:CDP-glycerol glycerophosphotransferase family protein n=1 Tax=Anaerofustis stercorihominis TaxID=214853 RepID=UPI00214C6D1B|nr:CDP-glycerol glycerophosphotransferase family protein [Anaerofustis stercorihominis]MCR2032999.1 CDP-glycerol glycerophosphotransferase family protein [Anaerofustis stercorihominis]